MRAPMPAFLLVVLLGCATARPVGLDEGGGVGDSIRLKTLRLLLAGDYGQQDRRPLSESS